MQPDKPFKDMTLEELEAWMVESKAEQNAMMELRKQAASVRADKIDASNLAKRLGQDVSHLSPDEVRTMLEIARKPKPGDVVSTPGVAVVTAKGQGGAE